MPDWLILWLGQIQGGILRTLAAELRAGGVATAWLALGALHALITGHIKAERNRHCKTIQHSEHVGIFAVGGTSRAIR